MKNLNQSTDNQKAVIKQTAKKTKPLIDNLQAVMRKLNHKSCPDATTGLRVILHLHQTPIEQTEDGITFGAGSEAAFVLQMPKESADFFMSEVVAKFHVSDAEAIRKVVRYQWCRQQHKGLRGELGAFYTPPLLAELIKEMLQPTLDALNDPVVFDSAAGLGGILGAFDEYTVVAADVDAKIVAALGDMGYVNVHYGNSLKTVSRTAYGIEETADLVIALNPPFSGACGCEMMNEADGGVVTKDLGMSFLLAAAKLKPEAICVLHPLSFLSKRTNFEQLEPLASNYKLLKGVVVSSADFEPSLGKTPFPVVAALYVPGSMTFADIGEFAFDIYEQQRGSMMDTGKRLILNAIKTTDEFIRKYPPKKGMDHVSDIGIYQYNFRDANFVIAKGALSCSLTDSSIPVRYHQLGLYSYINCFKRHFGVHFVFGNFSPLARQADFENQDFVDCCIYDTIMNNQHLAPMNRANPASFVLTKNLIQDARMKAGQYQGGGVNPHQAFVDFWANGTNPKALAPFFADYFSKLRDASLSVVPQPLDRIAGQQEAVAC